MSERQRDSPCLTLPSKTEKKSKTVVCILHPPPAAICQIEVNAPVIANGLFSEFIPRILQTVHCVWPQGSAYRGAIVVVGTLFLSDVFVLGPTNDKNVNNSKHDEEGCKLKTHKHTYSRHRAQPKKSNVWVMIFVPLTWNRERSNFDFFKIFANAPDQHPLQTASCPFTTVC